jgi:hypothetical protein
MNSPIVFGSCNYVVVNVQDGTDYDTIRVFRFFRVILF